VNGTQPRPCQLVLRPEISETLATDSTVVRPLGRTTHHAETPARDGALSTIQDRRQLPKSPPVWRVDASLAVPDRPPIQPGPKRQFRLAETGPQPSRMEPGREVAPWKHKVLSEGVLDPRPLPSAGLVLVPFPDADLPFRTADPLGQLRLGESQVEPALPQAFPEGLGIPRVSRG
jgi:hypothetical protein